MQLKSAIILSVVQGLTEFLPISSSGHLVLIKVFLKTKEFIFYDLVVHLGTTAAIVLVYRETIYIILRDSIYLPFASRDEKRAIRERGSVRLFGFIIMSTAVTGILGIIFRDTLKSFYFRATLVPVFLIINGFILISTTIVRRITGEGIIDKRGIKPTHSLLIGATQAVAIIPGISRSGITISTALLSGFKNYLAPMYSFLLSVPSIWGAAIFEYMGNKKASISAIRPSIYLISFILSFIVGFFSLKVLIKSILKAKIHVYGIYCIIAGILFLIILR